MEASGADKGFFQKPPVLNNQFHDDVTFQRCFKREFKANYYYTEVCAYLSSQCFFHGRSFSKSKLNWLHLEMMSSPTKFLPGSRMLNITNRSLKDQAVMYLASGRVI
jgi:hypothetical protein